MHSVAAPISAIDVGTDVRAIKFDWLMLAASAWFVGGLFIDGWAHFHLRAATESFFTPWHALLYSGYLACVAVLASQTLRHRGSQLPLWRRVPAHYEASALGVMIFAIGGLTDMAWHVIAGIETDVATQLSPSHLVMGVGIVLIVSGPFVAGAARLNQLPAANATFSTRLPALLSVALVLAVFNLFSKALQPMYIPWEAGQWHLKVPLPIRTRLDYLQEALGMGSFVVQTGIVMVLLLSALRQRLLPPGGVTLILSIATGLFDTVFLPVSVAGGIVADVLLLRLRPNAQRLTVVRIFSLVVPATLCVLFHVEVALTRGGIWWPAHLVVGSVVLTAIVGLAVSYLVFPPDMRA